MPDSADTNSSLPGSPNALPELATHLSGAEVVSALDAAARRGKLPGFDRGTGTELFQIKDFGTPFESVLDATYTQTSAGGTLRFVTRLKPAMPWLFAGVLVVSIWPGVWLTDSMIRTYFPSYPWGMPGTCAWYLPLTILPAPFAFLQGVRRSRTSASTEAAALIASIASLIKAPSASSSPQRP